MKKFKSFFITEKYRLKLMFHSDPKDAVWLSLLMLLGSLIPACSAWLWKKVIDVLCLSFHEGGFSWSGDLTFWLGVFLFASFYTNLVTPLTNMLSARIHRASKNELNQKVLDKLASIDVDFYDDPEKQDVLFAAQQSEVYIASASTIVYILIMNVITLLTCSVLLFSVGIWISVLFLFTYLPGLYVIYFQNKASANLIYQQVPSEREKDYYRNILTNEYYAKELRIYNIKDFFKKKHHSTWERMWVEKKDIYRKTLVGKLFSGLFSYGGLLLVIILSIKNVVDGKATVGSLILIVEVSKSVGEALTQLLNNYTYETEFVQTQMNLFSDFLNYRNKITEGTICEIPFCPEIEFQNVYFKYPNREEYAIENLSFTVESGKKIAIVGENGAGKTTILKLLLRFYEPEAGRILVNHKGIEEYSFEALYRVFSVCFQEVPRYALTLKENITLSDSQESENRINTVITAAAMDEFIDKQKEGINTPLTKELDDNGVELSGGQWQKVAIARALYKNAGIVLLDEPSSALDPESEDRVFQSINKLCWGKSAIIISHRLSSMTSVDSIFVMEKGKLIEKGTHDELIKLGSCYAKMYQLQANKYKGGA